MDLVTILCNGTGVTVPSVALELCKEFQDAAATGVSDVHVPDLNLATLPFVAEYLTHYASCPETIPKLPKPLPPHALADFVWESDFVERVESANLMVPLMVATYKLQVTGLTELSCAAISAHFRDTDAKTLKEIAEKFGQKRDFNKKEERQLRNETRCFNAPPTDHTPSVAPSGPALHFSVWMNGNQDIDDSVDPRDDFAVNGGRLKDFAEVQRASTVQPWQPDESVKECSNCMKAFGYLRRKHHCRACGQIFCAGCSSRTRTLPHDRRSFCLPPSSDSWWPWAGPVKEKDSKVRVCNECDEELEAWAHAAMWLSVLEYADALVPTLWAVSSCSRTLRRAAMARLSRIREPLYALPVDRDPQHFVSMWTHREHCRGHSRWLVQLIRSIPPARWKDDDTLRFVMQAVNEMLPWCKSTQRRSNCWAMMCSRLCQSVLSLEDAVEILADLCPLPNTENVTTLCISLLQRCSTADLRCFLPLFVRLLRDESDEGGLGSFLLDRAAAAPSSVTAEGSPGGIFDPDFASDLYWLLRVSEESHGFVARNRYNVLRTKLEVLLYAKTDLTHSSSEAFKRLLDVLNDPCLGDASDPKTVLRYMVHMAKCFQPDQSLMLPTAPHLQITALKADKAAVMASNARPLKLVFAARARAPIVTQIPLEPPCTAPSDETEVVALYKKDDLRVDQIMMSIIRFMQGVLQKAFEGEIDVNDILVTYNVVPVSSRAGFIEWVPNCRDVYSMNNTERKNIQSWIFSQPVNKLTPVDEVRNRFIHSSAAYTVISYLLGVGDRHKHNFMATTEGKFFHIDYGYVLGLHPNPILMAPHLRFTTQMVDFIGGPGTDEWKKFLDLTVRIFHCLRRRYSVVMRLLMLLVDADPPICDKLYTLDRVRTAIFGRFAPDQSDKAAEEAFRRRMETDTDRVDETLGDKMHRWSIDRVVSQAVRTAALSLSDVAYGTFSEIGTAVYTVGSIAHQYATRVTPDPPNDTSSPAP